MGTALLLASAAVLALVFAVSATSKAVDRRGSRQAILDFGVPALVAPAVGVLVPAAEAAAALALLFSVTSRAAAAVAAVLLVVFTGAIIANLLRGRDIECHCFGGLGSSRISWRSVVRNVFLLILALVVVFAPDRWHGRGLVGGYAHLSASGRAVTTALVLLGACLAVLAWLVVTLVKRHGAVLNRLDELEDQVIALAAGAGGTPLPPSPDDLTDRGGRPIAVSQLLADDRPTLLVAVRPNCRPCSDLLPHLAGWRDQRASSLDIAVLFSGTLEEAAEKLEHATGLAVAVQPSGQYADALGLDATPGALLLSPHGRVLTGPVFGGDDIFALVRRFPVEKRAVAVPTTAEPGSPLPSLELRDASGDIHHVPAASEEPSILLLWDPLCGFAQRIKAEVAEWQAQAVRPRLVVVSRGTAGQVTAEGLGDMLLLDPDFTVGGRLGAPGTPSAVAVRGGRTESAVAVGGPAVLELLTSAKRTIFEER